MENRLVDLWVRVQQRSEKSATLIAETANLASTWLRWLFGEKLISWQIFMVSFCLSAASRIFFLTYDQGELTDLQSLLELIAFVAFCAFAFYRARRLGRGRWGWFPAALVLVAMSGLYEGSSWTLWGYPDKEGSHWVYSFEFSNCREYTPYWLKAILWGVLIDVAILTENRLLVEKMKASRASLVLMSGLMVNLVVAIALYYGLFGTGL